MKIKFIVSVVCLLICLSCSKEDGKKNNNPYLIDPLVSLNLNLNLPEYNPLKFAGEKVIISQQGVKGIVIYNINNTQYTAFDLSDPNHTPSDCSKMTVEGVIASCPCANDSNEYNIVTGQHTTNPDLYPMQQYRAERAGDNIRVYN